ncbi:MAG: DUF1641 domain-containing protein [Acidilobus sp.]
MSEEIRPDEVVRAARAIGLTVGTFITSFLETLPLMASSLASAQGEPYSKLAEWADRTSKSVTEVLVREFPPEEVARMAEDVARSIKGMSLLINEVSKAVSDPQLLSIIKRTTEGFRKSLQAITSPNVSELMRALSDPDVVYALSVLLALLKALGTAIKLSSVSGSDIRSG